MSGRSMFALLLRHRRAAVIAAHAALVVLANFLAFSLRFDGSIPPDYRVAFVVGLPLVLAVRLATFRVFRLFGGLWRYVGVWDVRNILGASVVSAGLIAALIRVVPLPRGYPLSVIAIDAVLIMLMAAGMRLLGAMYRGLGSRAAGTRVLIVGAGDTGALVVREMNGNATIGAVPVGLVDDDRRKKGCYVYGVKVYGDRSELTKIIRETSPDEVLVAMPSVTAKQLREVVSSLEPFRLPIKMLPSMATLLSGRQALSSVRPLQLEDLLQRPSRAMAASTIAAFLRGKRILVTGAGGSIGSELSRQIATHAPAGLILVDRYENGLHDVGTDIGARHPDIRWTSAVADVTDVERMSALFARYRPQIVFHAAAHKHVPLMEANPCEGVNNNVGGTRVLGQVAAAFDVERFVLISTDKAVNPTSVMGATKRIAEMMVRDLARTSRTTFTTVRFGNVLGSNGSVVPLFLRQIAAGGPVTITHPEMRRFFMSIPEAVQLVLHAAVAAKSGELLVLEMGEQIKVVELARNMIRLSGLRPDKDIEVKVVGVRPGEKLCEELIADDEVAEPYSEMISRVQTTRVLESRDLWQIAAALEAAAAKDDVTTVTRLLTSIFPALEIGRLNPANFGVTDARRELADREEAVSDGAAVS